MNEQNWIDIYKALEYVYNIYGADIVTEPMKLKSLLFDLAPTAKKETKIFINILSEQDLIRRIRTSTDVNVSFVSHQIEDATGLSTEWAENTTKALIVVMGKKELTPVPSATTKQKQQVTSTKSQPVMQPAKSQKNENEIEGNQSVLGMTEACIGNGVVLFNGVYRYKAASYSSYLRFFPNGKVVGISSTGEPALVAQWLCLNNDYKANGLYTVNNDIINFTLTSSYGQVSYSGRILKKAFDIDVTSHINGHSARNLKYKFCSLP